MWSHVHDKANTQNASLHVLQQIITIDQVYQARFEHTGSIANMGPDGFNQLCMQDSVHEALLLEVYAVDELDWENNIDFPLNMTTIREEQDQDDLLQDQVQKDDIISFYFRWYRIVHDQREVMCAIKLE